MVIYTVTCNNDAEVFLTKDAAHLRAADLCYMWGTGEDDKLNLKKAYSTLGQRVAFCTPDAEWVSTSIRIQVHEV